MANININLKINEKIFQKDPQSTDLGRRILQNSILLIDEIGLERFTFGKLAKKIESTEASIYRYFDNKHLLFVYLLNWYWEWMKFRIDYNTMNIDNPKRRLEITLNVIVDTARRDASVDFIDEDILHQIVVSEGTKGYHTKAVDEENKDGYFLSYKTLCLKISENILAINPTFKYPRSLASTLIETANNSIYFAKHLPRLTDIEASSPDFNDHVIDLLKNLAFGTIQKIQKNGMPVENGKSIPIQNGS